MDVAIREADGVKIRFAEAGQRGHEVVVLTSPWPESLFAFRKVWDRLADQFHLVAIDLPGFGQSERQLDLLSPAAMGAFLVQLVREWELGPVHFVAPDVGTSAALWAAASDPARALPGHRRRSYGRSLAGRGHPERHHRGLGHGRLPPD